MIRIEVEDTKVTVKSGTSKVGKPYTIREQQGYAHVLDREGNPLKYPVPISVPLEDGQEPYPKGIYTVGPRSFTVGDFGALKVGRLHLVPGTEAVRRAA